LWECRLFAGLLEALFLCVVLDGDIVLRFCSYRAGRLGFWCDRVIGRGWFRVQGETSKVLALCLFSKVGAEQLILEIHFRDMVTE